MTKEIEHLWECIGRWSAYLSSHDFARLAPPDYLIEAIENATKQRTWEGLSIFEINELVEDTEYEDYRDLVERTECKLKQKNT